MDKDLSFSADEIELSHFSKALAHPARVAIIKELAKNANSKTCGELVSILPLSQPTTSQHLKILLKTGLICQNNKGNKSFYCIEWNKLERMFIMFGRLNGKTMENRPKRNCC